MTLRVLQVVGAMNRGGAEVFIMNMFREIRRYGIEFDFAVNTTGPGEFDDEIRALGGRILAHPNPGEAGFRLYGKALRRTLEHYGPFDAVHSHVRLFSGWVLRVAANAGVPVRIAHGHSVADGQPRSLKRQAYALCMRWLLRRNGTHLFGCSRAVCEAVYGTMCWKDPRVRVVPNAIRIEEYTGSLDGRKSLCDDLNIPLRSLLIGHVGNFREPKNHSFLLDLFTALSAKRPDARLILVGDGPLRPAVEAEVLARKLVSNVHFLGTRRDVPRLLGSLDVVVLPSLWEGIPVSIIEAQACGTPCVVSDVVPLEVDVGLGLVHFTSLSSGIASWIQAVLAQEGRQRPSWISRRKALEDSGYDIRRVARRLAQAYQLEGPE
jgi:glycosyltransferase involved in cell wall biosynthesis